MNSRDMSYEDELNRVFENSVCSNKFNLGRSIYILGRF